jgi:ABC-2 type transport system ATP-binding protein
MNAIEVRELTKRFGDFTAVDRISFNVAEGHIFGFLGANGAGKSTTIRMLCGLLTPTSGAARVGGFDVSLDPENVKRTIGYMSQRFSLYPDLTIEENLTFFGGVYGLRGARLQQRIAEVLRITDLTELSKRLTGALPGGVKQRLALGCAVIHEPRIVFLDEPTGGVDPIMRREFWNLINMLAEQGVTVLVTTHILDEAEYCNDIILIDGGSLIAQGSPAELKSDYMHEPLLELEAADVPELLTILAAAPGVRGAALFGASVHVRVQGDDADGVRLTKWLAAQGTEVTRCTRVSPTLEDVFLHLLERD